MYPMTGMGTTGSGLGMLGGISPQMIQMLMARQAMGGAPGSPMQAGGAPTPMSALAQLPQKQMGMAPMPPQVPNPNAQGGAQGMFQNPQVMQQLLAMFKGGQTGIPAQATGANGTTPMPPIQPPLFSHFSGAPSFGGVTGGPSPAQMQALQQYYNNQGM